MRPFTRAAFLSRILPAVLLASLLAAGLWLPVSAGAFEPAEPVPVGGGYYYDRGFGTSGLSSPNDVAVAHDGTVFVADTGNRRLVVLDSAGNRLRSWTYGAPPNETANEGPIFVECSPGGEIVVVFEGVGDSADFARRFTPTGDALGTEMGGYGGARGATGLAIDAAGCIYITGFSASSGDCMRKFSPKGAFITTYGTVQGFSLADPVIDSHGHFWLIEIVDSSRETVSQYQASGAVLNQFPIGYLPVGDAPNGPPTGVALGGTEMALGNMVVSLPNYGVLRQFSGLDDHLSCAPTIGLLPSSSDPGHMSSPRGLDVDARGSLYVADAGNNRVQRLCLGEPGSVVLPYDDVVPSEGVGKSNALDVVFVSGLGSFYTPGGAVDNGFGMIFDYMKNSGRYDVIRVPASQDKPLDPGAIWSYGPLAYNKASLASFLRRQGDLSKRKVLFVSHSMGGLISRAFVDDERLVRSADVVPKAIVQIGTPNTGSAMTHHLWHGLGLRGGIFHWKPALRDLSPEGAKKFNESNRNPTGVPIWGAAGDYFPTAAARHMALEIPGTPHQRYEQLLLSLNAAFLGPNDGWVSVASAGGSSLTQGHRGLVDRVNNAKHTQDLTYPFGAFENASYIKPMEIGEGSVDVDIEMYDDLKGVVEDAVADPAYYGVGGGGGGSGGGFGSDEGGAPQSSFSSLVHEIPASSTSPVNVPLPVNGSTSIVSARSDAGTVSLTMRDRYGTPVALEAIPDAPGTYMALGLTPGMYELQAALSGTSTALLTLDALEADGPVLRYDVPAQVVAGAAALVTASVTSAADATITGWSGQVVTDDGTIAMNDSGSSGDVTPADGVFSALVTAAGDGRFRDVTVIAAGDDPLGRPFQRFGTAVQSVGEPIASMAATGTLSPVYSGAFVSAMDLALSLRGTVDASVSVRAELVDSMGAVVAAGETESRVAAETTAPVTISFPAQLLHSGMSSFGPLRVSNVWLDQVLPDGSTTRIGHMTNVATSTVLSPSSLQVSYCSLRMDEGALAVESGVRLSGRAVCTTSRIATVQVSFDEGASWLGALPKDGSFDSSDEEYEAAFVLPDGVWRARSRALDANGHDLTPVWGDLTVPVDLLPPSTASDVDTNWHKSPHTVTLTPYDAVSAVTSTWYRVGDGLVTTYTGSFEVSGSGPVDLHYWSEDEVGETPLLPAGATLKLDATPPTVSSDATSTYARSASFSLDSTDSQSGPRSLSYILDGGNSGAFSMPPHGSHLPVTVDTLGVHRIDWTAQDVVGNTSTGTITFEVTSAPVVRVAGTSDYGTDVALSRATYNTGTRSAAVLISRDSTADAMCAPGLAGAIDGPIFMTPASKLATGVLDEMLRVLDPAGAKRVYIIGNYGAVSSTVGNTLTSAGLTVERLYGGTVYDSAVKVATKVKSLKGSGWAKTVFIVRHDNTAGGMAAAPYAYMKDYPLLFVTQNALPTTTSVALADLGVTYAYEMGSPTYISTTVHAAIDAKIQTAERINYTSRYDLARAMADKAISKGWATPDHTCFTTGDDYRTGIAGASAVGYRTGVLLQTSGSTVPTATRDFLADNKSGVDYLDIFGSEQEVPASVVSQLQSTLAP